MTQALSIQHLGSPADSTSTSSPRAPRKTLPRLSQPQADTIIGYLAASQAYGSTLQTAFTAAEEAALADFTLNRVHVSKLPVEDRHGRFPCAAISPHAEWDLARFETAPWCCSQLAKHPATLLRKLMATVTPRARRTGSTWRQSKAMGYSLHTQHMRVAAAHHLKLSHKHPCACELQSQQSAQSIDLQALALPVDTKSHHRRRPRSRAPAHRDRS